MVASKGAVANATGSDNGGKFILSDVEISTLSSTRGRKVVDSVYLLDVRYAMENPTVYTAKDGLVSGDIHAIRITEQRKASWIGPQLRKAARQLGIDTANFTVLDRTDKITEGAPMGFVAYWVSPAKPETATVSE